MAKIKYSRLAGITIAIIIFVDLVAGLIFIERRTVNIRTFHPYYHHGLKENRHSIEPYTQTKQYDMFTNSLGFRDGEIRNVPLTSDKYRIVFIGDSFTEGVGIPYDDTFAGIVEKGLGAGGGALNAGVVSYGASTYYYKIKYLLEHVGLKFDELYVLSDISDVYNDYSLELLDKFTPHLATPLFTQSSMKADKLLNDYSYIWHSFNIIYPYVKLRKFERDFPWWTVKDEVYNDWGKTGLEISGEYMQKLADLCRSRGIHMTIVVYPWTNLIEAKDLNSKQVTFWADFTRKSNIGFLNLFPHFINDTPSNIIIDKYFLPNDIHWNKEGHTLVANSMLSHILSPKL